MERIHDTRTARRAVAAARLYLSCPCDAHRYFATEASAGRVVAEAMAYAWAFDHYRVFRDDDAEAAGHVAFAAVYMVAAPAHALWHIEAARFPRMNYTGAYGAAAVG